MTAAIRPVAHGDWETITTIFNHFVHNSFAAYPEEPVEESFFRERHEANPEYPFVVAEEGEEIVGFAYLSPFHPVSTMKRSASITYFIDPDFTGQGLGTRFLDYLIDAAGSLEIANILAHISSQNLGSIRFHLRHGFVRCGEFKNIGTKNGEPFDMVWLQRELQP